MSEFKGTSESLNYSKSLSSYVLRSSFILFTIHFAHSEACDDRVHCLPCVSLHRKDNARYCSCLAIDHIIQGGWREGATINSNCVSTQLVDLERSTRVGVSLRSHLSGGSQDPIFKYLLRSLTMHHCVKKEGDVGNRR